jgi:hypothetical protein
MENGTVATTTVIVVVVACMQGDEMLLKDETILTIGMPSMARGILIGRFLHFEYSGFSVSDFVEGAFARTYSKPV